MKMYHRTPALIPVHLLLFLFVVLFTSPAVLSQSMEWTSGQNADVVLGQTNFTTANAGTSVTIMDEPASVAVDPTTRKVFVADTGNSRVLRFSSYEAAFNGGTAEAVLGQPDFDTVNPSLSATRMNRPEAVFVDSGGRLWVCDSQNGRVLRFDNASSIESGSSANGVLGKTSFTDNDDTPAANRLLFPKDVVVSSGGTLWVVDSFHSRILRFDAAAGKANGALAEGVLGQENFTDVGVASDADGLNTPTSLALSTGGSLWVGDLNNQRVLRFDNAAAKLDGDDADAVIGQVDLTSTVFLGSSLDSLPDTSGLAYSTLEDTLFVADQRNHRILVFEGASTANGRVDADFVLGNTGTNVTEGLAQNRVNRPQKMSIDSRGRLWVADQNNHRVLRITPDSASQLFDVRSDLTIGRKPGRQVGDDVINGSGAGQKARVTAKGTKRVKFFPVQQNDGDALTAFLLRGTRGNQFFKVSYRSLSAPAGNVTGAVVRGQLTSSELDTGEVHLLRIDVKPSRKTVGARKTFRGTLRSSDVRGSVQDVVKSQVKTKK